MDKIALVIVMMAVVVVAMVVGGIYLAMSGGGGGSEGGGGGGGTNPDIAGATSLQFSAELTTKGHPPITYKYSASNIGTSSMVLRIDVTGSQANFVYIVNRAQETAWAYENNEWTDISPDFPTQWNTWNSTWTDYRNGLLSWTGSGNWTYTEPNGVSVRIYDIVVNPSLADSLFQPN